jgi:hypothetical protein
MENTKRTKPQPRRSENGNMLYPVYFSDKLTWVTVPDREEESEMERARR